MPRDLSRDERNRQAKARRQGALDRVALGRESVRRESADGATSFPVKRRDANVDAAVEAFLSRRGRETQS